MIDALPLLPSDKNSQFDSRYRIVLVAAQRAKQIMKGLHHPQGTKFAKATSMALEEVLRGEVKYLVGKEAREALRESKRHSEREYDQSILAEGDEDAKEIQQQLSVYIDDSPKPVEVTEGAESGDGDE